VLNAYSATVLPMLRASHTGLSVDALILKGGTEAGVGVGEGFAVGVAVAFGVGDSVAVNVAVTFRSRSVPIWA
jgi:hypothetical protein